MIAKLLLGLGLLASPVMADDVKTNDVITEAEAEKTITEKIENVLDDHLDSNLIANIITWASEAGVMGALVAVYIKYSKYKNTTMEDLIGMFKKEIKTYLNENFDSLSANKLASIVDKLGELEKANETMMKVLVLAQDSTAKGKVALIDYLGTKTNSQEVKDAVKDVEAVVENNLEKEKAVNEKVEGKYEDIF